MKFTNLLESIQQKSNNMLLEAKGFEKHNGLSFQTIDQFLLDSKPEDQIDEEDMDEKLRKYDELVGKHDLTHAQSDSVAKQNRGAAQYAEIEKLGKDLPPAERKKILDSHVDRKISPSLRKVYYQKEHPTDMYSCKGCYGRRDGTDEKCRACGRELRKLYPAPPPRKINESANDDDDVLVISLASRFGYKGADADEATKFLEKNKEFQATIAAGDDLTESAAYDSRKKKLSESVGTPCKGSGQEVALTKSDTPQGTIKCRTCGQMLKFKWSNPLKGRVPKHDGPKKVLKESETMVSSRRRMLETAIKSNSLSRLRVDYDRSNDKFYLGAGKGSFDFEMPVGNFQNVKEADLEVKKAMKEIEQIWDDFHKDVRDPSIPGNYPSFSPKTAGKPGVKLTGLSDHINRVLELTRKYPGFNRALRAKYSRRLEDIKEADNFTNANYPDAKVRKVPDEEMQALLRRYRGRRDPEAQKILAAYGSYAKKAEKRKGEEKSNKPLSPFTPKELDAKKARIEKNKDKYGNPYIHVSHIERVKIVKEGGEEYDLDKLRAAIMERPYPILSQNGKLEKTSGVEMEYFNVGFPALKGLVVREDVEGQPFAIVDTCPGAGACKIDCYAMAGNYVVMPAISMKQTKMLNFLFNDPTGFQKQLEHEIAGKVMQFGSKNKKIGIRWHDSGDFFSDEYFKMACSIAKHFPDIPFYAYTKVASAATSNNKPKNFETNWSMEASPEQRGKFFNIVNAQGKNIENVKKSVIVPYSVFQPFIERVKIEKEEGAKKRMGESESKIGFKPGGEEQFKKALISWWDTSPDNKAPKFSLDPKTLISYQEYTSMKEHGSTPKWNVYVVPGRDGDVQASHPDVAGSWLLVH